MYRSTDQVVQNYDIDSAYEEELEPTSRTQLTKYLSESETDDNHRGVTINQLHET